MCPCDGDAGPGEVQRYVSTLRDTLSASAPRLQAVFEKPGSNELLADVQWGLLQRFAARSIKFALGLQQQQEQVPLAAAAAAEGGNSPRPDSTP